jgi:hypothetical protein
LICHFEVLAELSKRCNWPYTFFRELKHGRCAMASEPDAPLGSPTLQ